jgi:hypothetical protein
MTQGQMQYRAMVDDLALKIERVVNGNGCDIIRRAMQKVLDRVAADETISRTMLAKVGAEQVETFHVSA